jgi:hypothetical protein
VGTDSAISPGPFRWNGFEFAGLGSIDDIVSKGARKTGNWLG